MKMIVQMSDMKVSQRPEDILIAPGVGSGVGITLHDPEIRLGAMLHLMLPSSRVFPDMAQQKPLMFADTGIPILLEAVKSSGAELDRLTVIVAGGADLLDREGDIFRIGRKNYSAAIQLLQARGLRIRGEAIGGRRVRTLTLWVQSGDLRLDGDDGPEDVCSAL